MKRNYQEVWSNFFEDKQVDVQSKTARLAKWLADMIVENDFASINELYASTKKMKYSAQGYLESIGDIGGSKEKVVCVGYIYALIDMMQQYTEKLHVENEIYSIKTKYRDSVLYIIAKKGSVMHKDLASALGISSSSLNAVIKHINATSVKLINVSEVSKYKLYSLTPTALQYVTKNHNNDYFPGQKGLNKASYVVFSARDFEKEAALKSTSDYYVAVQNEEILPEQQLVSQLTRAIKLEENKVVTIEKAKKKFINKKDSIKMLAVE